MNLYHLAVVKVKVNMYINHVYMNGAILIETQMHGENAWNVTQSIF